MLRERNQTFKLAFIAIDFLLAMLAFASAVLLHFFILPTGKFVAPDTHGLIESYSIFGDHYLGMLLSVYFYLGLFYATMQIISFTAIDLYHPRRGTNYLNEVTAIFRGVALNVALVLALLFFYRGTTFSRLVILYAVLFSLHYHVFGHLLFRRFLRRLRSRGYNTRNVLLLGTGHAADLFAATLRRHTIYGYNLVGVVGPMRGAAESLRDQIVGSLKDLSGLTASLKPDLIVYALPHDQKMLQSLLALCDQEGLDLRILPEMASLITSRARIEDMDGMPILTIRDIPLRNGYNRFLKRSFDIVFSSLVLLLTAPMLLLLAIVIKLDSPGPIFFSQERVGLDRRNFKVLKFRSMRVQSDEESDKRWGSRGDDRVTRLGAFLRKSSIDELPQFLNVFFGDMSVVGPRPERPHFVSQFKGQYSSYMRRHAVKAGITGWAQIQGLRGDTSIEQRVQADIYYIENWSFWLDLVIVLRTIPSMVKNPGE